MKHDLQQIFERLGIPYTLWGKGPFKFETVAAADADDETALVFLSSPLPPPWAPKAASVLVPSRWHIEDHRLDEWGPGVAAVDDPKLAMVRILDHLDPLGQVAFIHPTAVIHECAQIDDRVRIHELVTIGGPGFGFVRAESGKPLHMRHIGTVVIEEQVEIFPHANVDRGTFGPTRIGAHTKIDHYAHVSHNCQVGKRCLITAGVILGGGTVLGDDVYMGLGSITLPKVRIGDGATVGAGAVVTKDVAAGATVAGVPAKEMQR